MNAQVLTAVDKLGSQVVIKKSPTLGMSPVVSLFMRGYAELIDNGFAYNNLAGHNKNNVIYVEIDNEVAGFIVYEIQDDIAKTCWIIFGSVLEKFRRRGLYKIMHNHLEKIAKSQGSTQIFSFVHKDNTAMMKLNESLGKESSRLQRYELRL
jgi:ribosomal protein S18 acetylase RimI-like enzyme